MYPQFPITLLTTTILFWKEDLETIPFGGSKSLGLFPSIRDVLVTALACSICTLWPQLWVAVRVSQSPCSNFELLQFRYSYRFRAWSLGFKVWFCWGGCHCPSLPLSLSLSLSLSLALARSPCVSISPQRSAGLRPGEWTSAGTFLALGLPISSSSFRSSRASKTP